MKATLFEQTFPEPLRRFVDQRVREGAYADAAEYLRDLVRRDREDQAVKRLHQLIDEGLSSGPATPLTEAEIADLRARARSVAG
jgi:antitoxin ParD1/3/4